MEFPSNIDITKKTHIAFDLDGTLAESKSTLTKRMANLLKQLAKKHKVVVISGGRFSQFKQQFLQGLDEVESIEQFILMPTSGSKMLKYNQGVWREVYSHPLSKEQKENVRNAFAIIEKEFSHFLVDKHGDRLEDRETQMSFSALGQQAPLDKKKNWDPDHAKRKKMVSRLKEFIVDLEIRIGGTTTIDITLPGIDKAYGMKELMKEEGLTMENILFIGDAMQPGGNDYPVKATGIDSIAVNTVGDTEKVITHLIAKKR